jgi:hypothetical protein
VASQQVILVHDIFDHGNMAVIMGMFVVVIMIVGV